MPLLRFGKSGDAQPQEFIRTEREALWSEDSARRVCGNPECAGGWTAPWRSRRRPIFEGQWGCSGRCVLAMVRAAVSRESGDGAVDDAPHRHRVPLGLVMLAQGWISQEQLRRALDAQRAHGTGRIGDWLVAECGVEAERVTRGLGVQWNCPVLTMEGFSPETMSLVMPRAFLEDFGLLPLRVAGSRILYLGFQDRMDASVALAVEQMTELRVVTGLLGETQFASAKSRLIESEGVAAKSETVTDTDAMAGRITAVLEQKQPVASRIVRVHNYFWLRMWMEARALGRTGNLPASSEDVMDFVFSMGSCA